MTDDEQSGREGGSLDEGGDFEDFDTGGTSLADLWRSNPMVKIGAVAAALVVIVGGLILFGGKSEAPAPSVMRSSSDVKETPGSGEVSQTYAQSVQERNRQEMEAAQKRGGSAMPVPISGPQIRAVLPEAKEKQEDPLDRWRRLQEERQKQEAVKKPEALPPPVATGPSPNTQAANALASAMSKQMESVLSSVSPKSIQYKTLSQASEDKGGPAAAGSGAAKAGGRGAAVAGGGETVLDILVPAGTIEYGQMITEANSDSKGPILAQIVSGPLGGSRLLGTFEVKEDKFLVLHFNTIVVEGISQRTDAVALDPKTAGTGVVTDVDNRYFDRVIWPAAAAFVQGLGSAISETGSTAVATTGGAVAQSTPPPDEKQQLFKGVEAAAQQIGSLLTTEAGKIKPLVTVAPGTPVGILFLQPVTQDVTE